MGEIQEVGVALEKREGPTGFCSGKASSLEACGVHWPALVHSRCVLEGPREGAESAL